MSYKIARGRVPTSPFGTPTRITTNTISSRSTNQNQPQNQSVTTAKPHPAKTPYSVCPPMNSLMIDVGGIAAISSGESATI